jgi:hypothetical protein
MTKQFWYGFTVCMVVWLGILSWRTIPEYTVIYRAECLKV